MDIGAGVAISSFIIAISVLILQGMKVKNNKAMMPNKPVHEAITEVESRVIRLLDNHECDSVERLKAYKKENTDELETIQKRVNRNTNEINSLSGDVKHIKTEVDEVKKDTKKLTKDSGRIMATTDLIAKGLLNKK